MLSLLLERVIEHACQDTWRNVRDDLKRIQLAQLSSPNGTVWQVTEPTAEAANRLKALKIKPPPAVPQARLTPIPHRYTAVSGARPEAMRRRLATGVLPLSVKVGLSGAAEPGNSWCSNRFAFEVNPGNGGRGGQVARADAVVMVSIMVSTEGWRSQGGQGTSG